MIIQTQSPGQEMMNCLGWLDGDKEQKDRRGSRARQKKVKKPEVREN